MQNQKIKETTARAVSGDFGQKSGGIELYLKRIFALMFGAVGVTAIAAYMTIWGGGLQYLINFQTGGMTGLYYAPYRIGRIQYDASSLHYLASLCYVFL